MYFPYFRGKQYELIVLRELVDILASKKVVPIIEPVKEGISSLSKTVEEFKKKKAPFIFIVNPLVGELKDKSDIIEREIIDGLLKDLDHHQLGYIISSRTKLVDVEGFLNQYSQQKVCLIHYHSFEDISGLTAVLKKFNNLVFNIFIAARTTKTYRDQFKSGTSKRVLVSDDFKSQPRNGDYPDSESFSDLFSIYDKEGYDGFGDFLIVGDEYFETGGPAYVVAIHLTYLNNNVIWIKHFLSDTGSTSPVDPGGKFLEALKKLVEFIDGMKLNTSACNVFRQLYKDQTFPGLGVVKKLSMKHHIETIAPLIK